MTTSAIDPADLILYGGTVWTADPAQPLATAVAIVGGPHREGG